MIQLNLNSNPTICPLYHQIPYLDDICIRIPQSYPHRCRDRMDRSRTHWCSARSSLPQSRPHTCIDISHDRIVRWRCKCRHFGRVNLRRSLWLSRIACLRSLRSRDTGTGGEKWIGLWFGIEKFIIIKFMWAYKHFKN